MNPVPLAYDERGSGEPALVFLHGWACDRTIWNGQVDVLARTHRVIAVDLAGHGASPRGPGPWSIESCGADVAALVRRLELERIVLVGHSMGGDVAVEAARVLPGRVAAIVWVDAYRSLPVERSEARIERWVAPFRSDFAGTMRAFVRGMFPPGADPVLVEHLASDMAAADPADAVEMLEASLRYGAAVGDTLAAIGVPVFAINPAEPPSDAQALARHGVRVDCLAGVGHFLMMEDAAAFNARLADQLGRVAGGR
jgi:pimeloyl-ACP methyl ester carboxylesterase